jgi:hypothetical protein
MSGGHSQNAAKARASVRNPLRASRWLTLGMVVFAFLVPGTAFASVSASEGVAGTVPDDPAATHTLLEAEYEFEKAISARVRGVDAAAASAAEALGRECKGVLHGAPDESVIEEEGPSASWPTLSGRAQGERARSEQEKQTIDQEIDETIFAPAYRVLRAPYEAFIATTRGLTWSEPTINALVDQRTARLREDLAGSSLAVCAEMRTWAASGFHLLPAGSKSLKEAGEVRDKQAVQGNLEALLRPYEGPAERAIVRRISALKERSSEQERTEERLGRADYHLQLALGEKVSRFAEQQFAPVIARGRTTAGTTFVVRPSVGNTFRGSCREEVQVEVREGNSGSAGGVCLSERARRHPSSSCSSSVETIEFATAPDVHRARVRLSDGRTLAVSIVQVPAKYGGPAGVFIEAFRANKPYPVSVQELGRDGKVLRTVRLGRVRCTKQLAGHEVGPPRIVNLATVQVPAGELLTISAISHRVGRQTEFSLMPGPSPRNSEAPEEHGKPKQFPWELSTECAPHPYTLLDGILAPPGASVLARTPTGLAPLTKVELAASTHAEGPLFYGVYETPPTEIVVQSSDGTVLYTENLAAKATEETEFCEGYAEP